MGKIFEALEKAGKDNKIVAAVQADIARTVEGRNAAPQTSDKPLKTKPVVARKDAPKRSISPSAPQKRKPQTVIEPTAAVEPVRSLERVNTAQEHPQQAATPDPAIQAEPSREIEGSTIVLVKPEKPDPAKPMNRAGQAGEAENQIPDNQPDVKKRATGRDISIRYSKTKVQVNDLEKLRNNKIFSVFDEMETTDQIKILRTQVLKKLKAIGGNTILVTSANPYEGKTFTSINLGVSIAKEFDRTVLIIDADLRKPTKKHTAFSTEFFSLNVEKGLTDYLMGECEIPDILINPGIAKLTLIPSGKPVYNAPELLNSLRMEEMMAEIKSRYSSDRLVIVDGPAMLPFPDAVILSRYVDGVLPVVEVEKTSTEDLKKMMDRLKGTQVFGTVLNKNRG